MAAGIDYERLDKRLAGMEDKMDKLAEAVATMAVQNQRLVTLEKETTLLFVKHDSVSNDIGKVKQFQASCPRDMYRTQLHALWVFVSAIIIAVIVGFVKG
jgi:hypothetical protein